MSFKGPSTPRHSMISGAHLLWARRKGLCPEKQLQQTGHCCPASQGQDHTDPAAAGAFSKFSSVIIISVNHENRANPNFLFMSTPAWFPISTPTEALFFSFIIINILFLAAFPAFFNRDLCLRIPLCTLGWRGAVNRKIQ